MSSSINDLAREFYLTQLGDPPLLTLTDAETAFYESVVADPEGKSIADLRYAFYAGVLNGDISLGGGGSSWEAYGSPVAFSGGSGSGNQLSGTATFSTMDTLVRMVIAYQHDTTGTTTSTRDFSGVVPAPLRLPDSDEYCHMSFAKDFALYEQVYAFSNGAINLSISDFGGSYAARSGLVAIWDLAGGN